MFAESLLPKTLDPSTPVRLFCFPHAGGGTAMFYRWQRFLPNHVALVPIRLPGREDRMGEPPYVSLRELANHAAQAVAELEPRPYVFLGHSLGGYVAFETTRHLLASGYPPPATLVVAACGAPREGISKAPIGGLPDEQFLDEVARQYDGIPDAVRDNPGLLAMVLPALRADIQMIESYDYRADGPLPVDILALGGANDPGVSITRLQAWQELTSATFTMRLFPGGHFFLHPPARRATSGMRDTIPPPLQLILRSLPPATEADR